MTDHAAGPMARAIGLVALVAAASCSEAPTASSNSTGSAVPGTATISVTANTGDVAALTLTISGDVDAVQMAGEGLAFAESVSGGNRVVALLPRAAAGPLLSFRVPDTRALGSYRVTVDGAADSANEPVDAGLIAVRLE
ncbi:MAG: hypothetical protein M8866_09715 [marine benthic group bacterium]|nr:hypothetical protein [Candidatus Benthicola marisminoris]